MARGITRKRSKARHVPARVQRRAGVMNKTEEHYLHSILMPRLTSGDLVKVEYEPFKVVLVHPDHITKRKESTYLPDFYCLRSDGGIEIHEVKGYCDEADRLKIKFASSKFEEWEWYMAHSTRRGREFKIERF